MAMPAGTSLSARPRIRALILAVVVIVTAAALVLNRLGAAEVCGSNEAVEGIFVQQMVEHGRLLFPLENGHSPMYKPPLFHWTATALDHLLGMRKVSAFNLRLPAAIYAVTGVILTVRFAWDFINPDYAWVAGLVLCGSYQYIEEGRIGRVDMTLCFFETLALMTFLWWYAGGENRRGWLRYLVAVALGLAVLAKGPVGAILPAAACGIFLLAQRSVRKLLELASPGPILVGLVVAGSWYGACFFGQRYAFLHRQLGSENFGRFFGALGTMPAWYYLGPILFNSAPLSLLVPFAVFFALRTYWHHCDSSAPQESMSKPEKALNSSGRDAVRLFAVFWLVSIAFFTLAAYKRRAYLLPLWPAAAVILTWWIDRFGGSHGYWGHWLRRIVILSCCGLILINAAYLPRHEIRECGTSGVQGAAMEIDRIVGRSEPLYLYGFGEDPAPLLFYLGRVAPPIGGKLGDAPPGYVIIPDEVWRRNRQEALDLTPIFESTGGRPQVILLRRGKALASTR